ncbi:MAG TPA: stalk domain-containing protein [Pseudobacteroides sp.]|uniref:stalk domain-containing protein n=1 Tax=Pseudobacteroides sp. TaxID=1968840 RepID=UPI002F933E80
MKKFITGFIACFVLMTGIAYAANTYQTAKYKILINGTEYKGTDKAIVVDSRTYLPLRAIGEILGASVDWNEVQKQVEITGGVSIDIVEDVPPTPTPTPVSTPNPNVQVGKNEFIAHDNMQKRDVFKVSVLGKVADGETVSGIKYEIWKFRFENIDKHEQYILPSQLGWNRGAILTSVAAPDGYELIQQKKLKPGEVWEGVAVLKINSDADKLYFFYENGKVQYQE